MPRCTRNGCGLEYNPTDNSDDSCAYHSGGPVFHEGLKSWSCCSDVHKPVLEFDEFLKISGCSRGKHTDADPQQNAPKLLPSSNLTMTESKEGKEVYSSGNAIASITNRVEAAAISPPPEPMPVVEEEDDPDIPVAPGTICRRKGCGTPFISDEINRKGDDVGIVCTYHPAPPIFREGSKGYLCCKRRVLEFDEFLKIKGCKKGRHVFAPKVTERATEEIANCRIDHYQTPTEVHVSVFAKQVDKERSTIRFEKSQLHFDLYLHGSKRFRRTLNLFGPIDDSVSSFKFFGSKVEVLLKKDDNRSWTVLEKTDQDLGNINLTFGVGGRTGTIGGKEVILDEVNKNRA